MAKTDQNRPVSPCRVYEIALISTKSASIIFCSDRLMSCPITFATRIEKKVFLMAYATKKSTGCLRIQAV